MKMDRTSAELHEKIACSQKYNFEHQNLIITAFLNSWAFCGQCYKRLKVEKYRHFPYSQSNIFLQYHSFITNFEISKTVVSINRLLPCLLITFAVVLNVLSRNLQQKWPIYRAERMWGLNEVQWLNAGTENDLKKILEAQRNLSLLHGGCLNVRQQPWNSFFNMFFSRSSIF